LEKSQPAQVDLSKTEQGDESEIGGWDVTTKANLNDDGTLGRHPALVDFKQRCVVRELESGTGVMQYYAGWIKQRNLAIYNFGERDDVLYETRVAFDGEQNVRCFFSFFAIVFAFIF
jgi:hypothetical protein